VNCQHRLKLLVVAFLLAGGTAAKAGDERQLGGWKLYLSDRSCAASHLASLEARRFIYFGIRSDRSYFFRMNNPDWTLSNGQKYPLKLMLDNAEVALVGIGASTSDGIAGFISNLTDDNFQKLSESKSVNIVGEALKQTPISLPDLGLAVDGIRRCARPFFEGPIQKQLPTATSTQSLSLGDADYPKRARKEKREGDTAVRVTIDVTGKPSECKIVQSSNSNDLDLAACKLMIERARFRPATDPNGKPVESEFQQRVRWRL
jgi:TonB family protein